MATREQQKAERRAQILRVALDVFLDKGFYGATTTEIAARCQMSSGLMFHYFDTKEALYTALLENAATGMSALSQAVPPGTPPLAAFEGMAAFTLGAFATSPETLKTFVFVKQVMTSTAPVPGTEELLLRMDAINPLSPLVMAGQASGEIRPGDPVAMTTLFFSSLQGIAEMLYRYPHLPLPDPSWLVAFMKEGTR